MLVLKEKVLEKEKEGRSPWSTRTLATMGSSTGLYCYIVAALSRATHTQSHYTTNCLALTINRIELDS